MLLIRYVLWHDRVMPPVFRYSIDSSLCSVRLCANKPMEAKFLGAPLFSKWCVCQNLKLKQLIIKIIGLFIRDIKAATRLLIRESSKTIVPRGGAKKVARKNKVIIYPARNLSKWIGNSNIGFMPI